MEKGTLKEKEPHPAIETAITYLISLGVNKLHMHLESFSSMALTEHNRLAEVCAETLRRWLYKEPLSDRYFLGLAWTIKEIEEEIEKRERVKR